MKIKILVFPRDVNPYQSMLHHNLDKDVKVTYFQNMRKPRLINMVLTPVELIYFRLKGYKLLHLHWVFPFYFSSNNFFLMLLSEFYLHMFLYCLRSLGYKLVWTVHDLLPHEKTFTNDQAVSQRLADASDFLIVLNTDSKNTLINNYGISPKKVALIPIGNYIEYYPMSNKSINRRFAKEFLFFGQIKPYKGIDSLINSFKSLNDSSIRLNVVGPSNDRKYFNVLLQMIGNDERISIRDQFVPNNLVGGVFSASDVVVLPFKEVTNTSSAILAFSMKKPVIAPLIGMIRDFPLNTGFYYDPNDVDGLAKSILAATKSKEKLEKMSKNAFAYAQSLGWREIAENTLEIYKSLSVL